MIKIMTNFFLKKNQNWIKYDLFNWKQKNLFSTYFFLFCFTNESCWSSECCYATSFVVCQKFQVEHFASTLLKAFQQFLPTGLIFKAMCKENVRVNQRTVVVFRQFFQTDNVNIFVGWKKKSMKLFIKIYLRKDKKYIYEIPLRQESPSTMLQPDAS